MSKTGILLAGALLLSACICLAQDLQDPFVNAAEFPVSDNAENQEFHDFVFVREAADELVKKAAAESPELPDAAERNESKEDDEAEKDLIETEKVKNANVADGLGDDLVTNWTTATSIKSPIVRSTMTKISRRIQN